MAATPPLEELVRRIHERDTTLDLGAITLDLVDRLGKREERIAALIGQLDACRLEVQDRDQRIDVLRATEVRQGAVVEILRERMAADLATHRLAQAALAAFDRGAAIIP